MIDEKFIGKKLNLTMPWNIGLVITKGNGKTNVCPITFHTISSTYEKPFVICIGLDNRNFTLENIKSTKEFTFAYPTQKQLKDTLYCGTVSGKNVDKLKNTLFRFNPSKYIFAPRLNHAVANFECKVIHFHKLKSFTIVIGEILNAAKSGKTQLDKVYALGELNYGSIKEIQILQKGRGKKVIV